MADLIEALALLGQELTDQDIEHLLQENDLFDPQYVLGDLGGDLEPIMSPEEAMSPFGYWSQQFLPRSPMLLEHPEDYRSRRVSEQMLRFRRPSQSQRRPIMSPPRLPLSSLPEQSPLAMTCPSIWTVAKRYWKNASRELFAAMSTLNESVKYVNAVIENNKEAASGWLGQMKSPEQHIRAAQQFEMLNDRAWYTTEWPMEVWHVAKYIPNKVTIYNKRGLTQTTLEPPMKVNENECAFRIEIPPGTRILPPLKGINHHVYIAPGMSMITKGAAQPDRYVGGWTVESTLRHVI